MFVNLKNVSFLGKTIIRKSFFTHAKFGLAFENLEERVCLDLGINFKTKF